MNKESKNYIEYSPMKHLFRRWNGRIRDIVLLSTLALVLIVVTWQIFHTEDPRTVAVNATETELKVIRLLEEIDGVGEANVIVCETEEGITSVVVVCEGANNLRVVMDVREAVAAALGTEEKAVKIYLKKE